MIIVAPLVVIRFRTPIAMRYVEIASLKQEKSAMATVHHPAPLRIHALRLNYSVQSQIVPLNAPTPPFTPAVQMTDAAPQGVTVLTTTTAPQAAEIASLKPEKYATEIVPQAAMTISPAQQMSNLERVLAVI